MTIAGRRAPAVRRMGSGGHHGGDFHISPVHLQLSKVCVLIYLPLIAWIRGLHPGMHTGRVGSHTRTIQRRSGEIFSSGRAEGDEVYVCVCLGRLTEHMFLGPNAGDGHGVLGVDVLEGLQRRRRRPGAYIDVCIHPCLTHTMPPALSRDCLVSNLCGKTNQQCVYCGSSFFVMTCV